MNISDYIKTLRDKKNYTLNQLALYSGVSAAHISRIENNKRNVLPDTLKKLAPILDVSYEELMYVAGYLDNPEIKEKDDKYLLSEKDDFKELLEKANLYFNNSKISIDEKEKVKDNLLEIYWEAKTANKFL